MSEPKPVSPLVDAANAWLAQADRRLWTHSELLAGFHSYMEAARASVSPSHPDLRPITWENSTVDGSEWEAGRFLALDFSDGELCADRGYPEGCLKYVRCDLDNDPTMGHRVRSTYADCAPVEVNGVWMWHVGGSSRPIGAATVSLPQAPAEAPAATEEPTQELLQDALLLASAVCNQADDGIDRGAFILTRAIQVRKALRDRFRLDENEVCIDCGHDACDCPPVATEGPGAPPRDPQAICYDVLLHRLQLAVCDPREAVKGNLPSRAKAVELAIDAVVAQQKAAVPGAGSAAQDARTKLLMKFWVAKHEAGIVDEWEAQEKLSIAALTELLRGETTTHKWEPDFSNGECLGCKTCGVCGTTHQTSVEDAELIDRQYLQICVLKADQDALRQSLSSGDYPLLARHLSREYNFSSQADRDQAMRMGKELFAAGKSAGASSEGAGSAEPTK